MIILIVDDEQNIRATLKDILEDEGFDTFTASNGDKALKTLAKEVIDLVILDVKLPGMDGIEVFKKVRQSYQDLDVLMISGHSGIETAVQAVKLGAYDFLEKPLSMSKILTAARNIQEKRSLQSQVLKNKTPQINKYELIGKSPQMAELLKIIDKVAPTESKVLIRGESGTGKELVAYAIHEKSRRKLQAFIKFNSAAIPSGLVESELFGHEKGAFTGAETQKLGKLEQANGGTLFLDEIGDMDLMVQAKILRVIQEGTFERVGGNNTIHIDVRLLAATHKNLEEMVQNKLFRNDLFYRLNVIPTEVPPLRERIGDIKVLVEYYLEVYAQEFNVWKKSILPTALEKLVYYPFPGNVRELKNLIERLYILVNNDFITEEDILPHLRTNLDDDTSSTIDMGGKTLRAAKGIFEYEYIRSQMEKSNWNISQAAKKLGMQQPNLTRKLKELGIKKG